MELISKKTKIIATVGPKSESKEIMSKIFEEGVNIIRLNFSHGDYAEQQARIDTCREIIAETNKQVGILLDTKGPEIRTGEFNGEVALNEGDTIIITPDEVIGDNEKFTVTYKDLCKEVKVGDRIMLDDGLIGLLVIEEIGSDIVCRIENSGIIKSKKGVNVPGVDLNFPFMSAKDKSDIEFACDQNLDYIAASFVRRSADIQEIRDIIAAKQNKRIQIISKVESQTAVDNIDEIIESSDAIMIARGDLGIEIPVEEVPVVQKDIIRKCNMLGVPVITATQMLETMQQNPRPTRAEANDVANAIYDGTDAVMLSGETAAGKYPVEAVNTMKTIARRAENDIDYVDQFIDTLLENESIETNQNIALAAVLTANKIGAKAIIAGTESGRSVRLVSKIRPECPIIALTANADVARSLTLCYGVKPIVGLNNRSLDELVENTKDVLMSEFNVQKGDKIVLVAGQPAGEGNTNLLRVIEF
jgi:pyruvate kinase